MSDPSVQREAYLKARGVRTDFLRILGRIESVFTAERTQALMEEVTLELSVADAIDTLITFQKEKKLALEAGKVPENFGTYDVDARKDFYGDYQEDLRQMLLNIRAVQDACSALVQSDTMSAEIHGEQSRSFEALFTRLRQAHADSVEGETTSPQAGLLGWLAYSLNDKGLLLSEEQTKAFLSGNSLAPIQALADMQSRWWDDYGQVGEELRSLVRFFQEHHSGEAMSTEQVVELNAMVNESLYKIYEAANTLYSTVEKQVSLLSKPGEKTEIRLRF